MKILLIANINSVLIKNLAGELARNADAEIQILDFSKGILIQFTQGITIKEYTYPKNSIRKKIFIFFRTLISLVKLIRLYKQDYIMIHYVVPVYGIFSIILKHKGTIISTLYGSDFYLLPVWKASLQYRIFTASRWITFSNQQMSEDFTKKYPRLKPKIKICRFGLSMLENIDDFNNDKRKARELLHFPHDKLIITCGHSASIREQHIRIIETLNTLPSNLKVKIFLVFPLTYSLSDELYRTIQKSLQQTDLSFKLLTGLLSGESTAGLRVASDIMLNLPLTDQMTAAMLETLYAGGYVITGSWLPYQVLDNYGISYEKVSNIEALKNPMEKAIFNQEHGLPLCDIVMNRQIVQEHFSWPTCINDWVTIL